MVSEKFVKNKKYYQCEACGFLYKTKEVSDKCEKWCRKHKSCNMEIIKEAVKV